MTAAFLSYTRLDDEFFGGSITALRKLLELGVQVVTGDRNFSIFQDIDGIELGQRWQERLDSAVDSSTFLIPVMTPCFFSSNACREEIDKFFAHEKKLRRSDLILPIYFVTTPLIERQELLKEDIIALEVSKRQRFDWREQADLPMADPEIRRSVKKLASSIQLAMSRVNEPNVDDNKRAAAFAQAAASVSEQIEKRKSKTRSSILWVDDRPSNNVLERRALSEYNIDFEIAKSTEEALAILNRRNFDAIISDMGRPPDPKAGYTLLEALRSGGNKSPYFIYAGSRAPEHTREALSRGAQGNTNRADELIQMVLRSLGTLDQ